MSVVTTASERGVRFIANHESPGGKAVRKAYRCPAGVITIGHGFTMGSATFAEYWGRKHGRGLKMGDTIGQAEADRLLGEIVDAEYGAVVARDIEPRQQHHYDGAASMTFNCGTGAVGWRWAKALARGDVSEAARLLRTTAVTANGRRLAGLVRRRNEEADLIEHGRYGKVKGSTSAISTDREEIEEYQRQLIKLGYDLGEAGTDGDAGPLTKAAVKQFQKDHDLTVDGIVGPATRATLIRALDAKNANKATGGAGAAGGAGTGAVESGGDPSALADINLLAMLGMALAAAALIAGGYWLYRNRGRITGRRVPT